MIIFGVHPEETGGIEPTPISVAFNGEAKSLSGADPGVVNTFTVGVSKKVDEGRSGTRNDVIYNSPTTSMIIRAIAAIAEDRFREAICFSNP
jgi:hypothetical protein